MRHAVARPPGAVALALALLTGGGCGPPGSAVGVAVHVDPPHWPSDLPDAVDRLLDGQEAAREALAGGRVDEARDDLVPVVRDLARWLPQVAADSDMPEPEWDRVDRISARLVPIFEGVLRDLDREQAVPPGRLAEADPLLDDLRRAVVEADPSWFAPLPDGGSTSPPGPDEPGGDRDEEAVGPAELLTAPDRAGA